MADTGGCHKPSIALLVCLLCLHTCQQAWGHQPLLLGQRSTGSHENESGSTWTGACAADVCFIYQSTSLLVDDFGAEAEQHVDVHVVNRQPLSGFSLELMDEDCQRVRIEAAKGGLLADMPPGTSVVLGYNLLSVVVQDEAAQPVVPAHSAEAKLFTQLRHKASAWQDTCLHKAAAQLGSQQLSVQVLGCRFDPALTCASRATGQRRLQGLQTLAADGDGVLHKDLPKPARAAQQPQLRGVPPLRHLHQHAKGIDEPMEDAEYLPEDEGDLATSLRGSGSVVDDQGEDYEAEDSMQGVSARDASSSSGEQAGGKVVASGAKPGAQVPDHKGSDTSAGKANAATLGEDDDEGAVSDKLQQAAAKPSGSKMGVLAEDMAGDADAAGAAAAGKPSKAGPVGKAADAEDPAYDDYEFTPDPSDSGASAVKLSDAKAAAGKDKPSSTSKSKASSEDPEDGPLPAKLGSTSQAKGGAQIEAGGKQPSSKINNADADDADQDEARPSAGGEAAADDNGEDQMIYNFEYDEETGETVEVSTKRGQDKEDTAESAAEDADNNADYADEEPGDSVSDALVRDAVMPLLPSSSATPASKTDEKGFLAKTKEVIFGGGSKEDSSPPPVLMASYVRPSIKTNPNLPNVAELDLAGASHAAPSAGGADMLTASSKRPPWRDPTGAEDDPEVTDQALTNVESAASDSLTHSLGDAAAVEEVAKRGPGQYDERSMDDSPEKLMRGPVDDILQASGRSFINVAIIGGLVVALLAGLGIYVKYVRTSSPRVHVIEMNGLGKQYSRVGESEGRLDKEDSDSWEDTGSGRVSQRRTKSLPHSDVPGGQLPRRTPRQGWDDDW